MRRSNSLEASHSCSTHTAAALPLCSSAHLNISPQTNLTTRSERVPRGHIPFLPLLDFVRFNIFSSIRRQELRFGDGGETTRLDCIDNGLTMVLGRERSALVGLSAKGVGGRRGTFISASSSSSIVVESACERKNNHGLAIRHSPSAAICFSLKVNIDSVRLFSLRRETQVCRKDQRRFRFFLRPRTSKIEFIAVDACRYHRFFVVAAKTRKMKVHVRVCAHIDCVLTRIFDRRRTHRYRN